MGKNIGKRLAMLVVILMGVTILTFVYTNLSPVDAGEALAVRRYGRPTALQIENVQKELGLDKPVVEQYFTWLKNAMKGNFGNSYQTGRPIIEELLVSIKPTIIMAILATVVVLMISVPLGILSAKKKGGFFDKTVYLFGVISMSIPNYCIGFFLLIMFAVNIPLFNLMGADSFKDYILPAISLAIPVAAGNIRIFRSSLLEGYNSDFVMYARARGVSEFKIAGMVSRYAFPPLVTLVAQGLGFMIAGSAMVEYVFAIRGLGTMMIDALQSRDTITINACVLTIAAIFVIVNFMADMINIFLNPVMSDKGGNYDW